jgi:phage shock protein E|tara:strand:- start:921 stop:1253 length:333 start_codon:yes stop_codon:yes gene_type:complete
MIGLRKNFKYIIFLFLAFPLFAQNEIIIDVRTIEEWKKGHLDGAIHVEWQDILSISDTVAKDKKLYLYCRSGNRSGKATKMLNEIGYHQAINAGSIKKAKELLNRDIIYN